MSASLNQSTIEPEVQVIQKVKEEGGRPSQRKSNAKRKALEAGIGEIELVVEPPAKVLRRNEDQEGMPEVRTSYERKRRTS